MKIAYFLNLFPAISETFILNEIIALRKAGVDIYIFSIFNPKNKIVHAEAVELSRETYYVRKFCNIRQSLKKICTILYANLFFLILHPIKYLRAFHFAFRLDSYRAFKKFGISVYLSFMLAKLKIRHIHVHFAFSGSEYAMIASMISNVSYSLTIHANDMFTQHRFVDEKIRHAKFIIAISEYGKNHIKNMYKNISEDKIYVIHCGVKIEKLAKFQRESYDKEQSFLILSVGRLVEKKGFQYLLEACSKLIQKGISDFKCSIVGHGPLKRELEELIFSLGLIDRVEMLGPLSSEKVFSLLNKADIVVLYSVVSKDGDMDGIPVALMEAMALEKPVISTCISGIPELVRNGAGILVPPRNSQALADAIEGIYFMDLPSRKRMGQKGREIVEREFNIEEESKKIYDLFTKCLQEKREELKGIIGRASQ